MGSRLCFVDNIVRLSEVLWGQQPRIKNFAEVCQGIVHAFASVSDMGLQGGQRAAFELAAFEMRQSALPMRRLDETVALDLGTVDHVLCITVEPQECAELLVGAESG